jgi:predicted small secreted protein
MRIFFRRQRSLTPEQVRPSGRALTPFFQEDTMKKLVAFFLLLVFAGLAGCNTMEGLGKDVSRGGDKLSDEAREQRAR